MNPHKVIQSQYLASLEMLKQVIVKCPDALWNAPGNQDKSWNYSFITSGTFNNAQVNCMIDWEYTKISSLAGFHPANLKEHE